MKPFVVAVVAAVAIALGASVLLGAVQELAYQKFQTSAVRLSSPGTNLVGLKWNGDPTPADITEMTRDKAEEERLDAKGS
ncbi:hypothetical protein [Hansschlegelia beijingensis]|uniref:Uncharacterized protein n=1 Tax=Hansschlegelia beijingensis TaxID=1133344 RepID=A0A7W6CZQ8_9HYPH|nr:hypothetical protein [Hansschlegelia beijingensis]MBB3974046.1 hypothetical protein [Hansschlegelia beijingensis]